LVLLADTATETGGRMIGSSQECVLYIDVFFMVNVCLDLMILYATRCFIKSHHHLLRIWFGAFVGGIYSVLVFCTPLHANAVLLNIANVLAAGLMSLISFPTKQSGIWIKQTIQLYIVTFIAGGIMNMLYYSTQFGVWLRMLLYGGYGTQIVFTFMKLLGIATATYVFLHGIWKFLFHWKREQQNIHRVRLIYNQKEVSCQALYDTGNALREPITGEQVHLAEYEVIKDLWDKEAHIGSMYVIPYQSVGESHGVLYGIRVERLIIGEQILENPIIAIYKGKLSAMGSYSMILNSETFEGCLSERKG
jgi:stage II sporulation protein GA (sporulation sigma-E factor processing peptidase)